MLKNSINIFEKVTKFIVMDKNNFFDSNHFIPYISDIIVKKLKNEHEK
ncbi:hypothetical protein [Sulfurospirillum arcachonense]|nr:hypothetical protein [Sulfurospirillum arcachonense]